VCGEEGGAVYIVEIFGFEYQSIVVTAAKGEKGIEVCCPKCMHHFQIKKTLLGNEIACPQANCNTRLRVNPLIIHPAQEKKSWLPKLLKK
jgi:hypothetical protein